MGDYRMDDDDRRLRELFMHADLADKGFSERVLKRIWRRAALQRLLLPLALLAGGVVATGPVLSILDRALSQFTIFAGDFAMASGTFSALPGTLAISLPLLLGSAMLLFWLQE